MYLFLLLKQIPNLVRHWYPRCSTHVRRCWWRVQSKTLPQAPAGSAEVQVNQCVREPWSRGRHRVKTTIMCTLNSQSQSFMWVDRFETARRVKLCTITPTNSRLFYYCNKLKRLQPNYFVSAEQSGRSVAAEELNNGQDLWKSPYYSILGRKLMAFLLSCVREEK